MVRGSVGGRKKRLVATLAALNAFGFRKDDCHSEKCGAGIAGSPIGRMRLRTPNVSVTTSDRHGHGAHRKRERDDEPVVPVAAEYSIIKVARGRSAPRAAAHMPGEHPPSPRTAAPDAGKFTGAGIVASTMGVNPWSAAVVRKAWLLTSNELQSIGPSIRRPSRSSVPGVRRQLRPDRKRVLQPRRVPGIVRGPARLAVIESYRASSVAACCTFARWGRRCSGRDRRPAARRRSCAAGSRAARRQAPANH